MSDPGMEAPNSMGIDVGVIIQRVFRVVLVYCYKALELIGNILLLALLVLFLAVFVIPSNWIFGTYKVH